MPSESPRLPAFLSRVTSSRLIRKIAPLAAVAVLSLTAIHPSTFRSLPDSPDGQLHLYRLVAFDHAVRRLPAVSGAAIGSNRMGPPCRA
ncbi:MAG: hypothetical protein P8Z40_10215 [Chloroflexota bacterium]